MFTDLLNKLIDALLGILFYIPSKMLEFIVALFQKIPVPEFLQSFSPYTISGHIAWFLEPWQITHGIAIIGSAYAARFILRRIPFIG